MKEQSKYKEIGNLQLFKPDYINQNKKTLLTSNIIKEYLRKRKGKYYYKVNYIKNKFKFSNEIDDIVNKRMHYKLILNSYREMKSEIYKRHLNGNELKESNNLKLIDNNNNLLKKKNRSRNNEIFKNPHKTFHYGKNIFDKYNKFRKANSEVKILPINNIKELSTNLIDSNGNTSLNKNSKKITPSDNSYLIGFIKNSKIKIKKLFKRNSPNETNSTQRNTYKNNSDISNEIIKSFSNNITNITHNKLPILNNDKDNKDKNVIDPYFSLDNDPKKKLKMQYNFFRLENEDDINLPLNKFRIFQKKLFPPKKIITNKKFHFSYVQYVIDNIKRKEKELNDSKKETNKPNKILIKKKINKNNNKYINNDNNVNEIMFRSFNGKIF